MKVDHEFRALIPPLMTDELRQLEENIQRDGCRDPLTTWSGILLDGHNRLDICDRIGVAYQTVEIALADRSAAKEWIIRNQFGRRNLQPFQRAELVLRLEPLIAAKAKENERQSGGRGKGLQNSVNLKPVDTQKELAELSGLSHDTIHKAKVIMKSATPEAKAKLRSGDSTINREYQKLRKNQSPLTGNPPRARSMPTVRPLDEAIAEGQSWMRRWSHISVLAPVFDLLSEISKEAQ